MMRVAYVHEEVGSEPRLRRLFHSKKSPGGAVTHYTTFGLKRWGEAGHSASKDHGGERDCYGAIVADPAGAKHRCGAAPS